MVELMIVCVTICIPIFQQRQTDTEQSKLMLLSPVITASIDGDTELLHHPSTHSSIIATLTDKTTVTIIGTSGDYTYIKISDFYGYVVSTHIKLEYHDNHMDEAADHL